MGASQIVKFVKVFFLESTCYTVITCTLYPLLCMHVRENSNNAMGVAYESKILSLDFYSELAVLGS